MGSLARVVTPILSGYFEEQVEPSSSFGLVGILMFVSVIGILCLENAIKYFVSDCSKRLDVRMSQSYQKTTAGEDIRLLSTPTDDEYRQEGKPRYGNPNVGDQLRSKDDHFLISYSLAVYHKVGIGLCLLGMGLIIGTMLDWGNPNW